AHPARRREGVPRALHGRVLRPAREGRSGGRRVGSDPEAGCRTPGAARMDRGLPAHRGDGRALGGLRMAQFYTNWREYGATSQPFDWSVVQLRSGAGTGLISGVVVDVPD